MSEIDLKVREKEFRRHPLAHCEDCPLFPEGEFVPSCGPKKAELAVVGEAPGANEARAGRPFIGVSGQLLDRVLQHYDIDRRRVFISNATLCRSPDGATPTAKAINACRPRLMWELADREVRSIVACGNSAAQSILATSTGITSLRVGAGRTNEKDLPGVRVVPTFHPAAALRMPNFFPSIVTDFGKLKGRHASWYEPVWRAYDDPDIALRALGELGHRPLEPVVVDIESQIEKDVSFETPSRHDLLCVGVGYARGKVVVFGHTALRDGHVRDALRRYLVARPIVGQNFKFDAKGLWAKLDRAEFHIKQDTMLSSYCLDERQGVHALDYQAIEKLGAPNWKHALDKYNPKKNGYAAVPKQELYFYNARDIHATDLVAEVNGNALTEEGLWGLHDFLCRASEQLMFVELNGIAIDREYNRELDRMFIRDLARLRGEIQATIPQAMWEELWGQLFPARANKMQDYNPNSPVQTKGVIKDIFGMRLPRIMNQKKEYAETTNADALDGLLAKSLGGPAEAFFRGMLDHRKEAKSHGTYVKGIYNRMWHGRVYSTYLLHGTTTGRLSSRNPNLQNITRGSQIRRQFVPARAENIFVEGDFKQAELRVLCWLAQDEFLRDIFNDPTRDLFDELTPRLYGDVSGLDAAQLKELRIRVKAYCMTKDALIFTKRGWLTHDQVRVGDETIGYDLNAKCTRWTRIKAVQEFGDQEVVTVTRRGRWGESFRFTCTPSHKWVADKWRGACAQHGYTPKGHFCDAELTETQQLTTNSRVLLGARFQSDSKLDITDEEAAILGWLMTDGTIKYYPAQYTTHVTIFQHQESPWTPYIETLVQNKPVRRSARAGSMYQWRFQPTYARDLLARAGLPGVLREGLEAHSAESFILSMSDSQRRAFLEAFCQAEGEKLDQKVVYQFNSWQQSAFKLAAYLEGYLVSEHKNGGRGGKFRLCRAKFRMQTIHVEKAGAAPVWCVETELGSWTVQQGGATVITGNCYGLAYGREAHSIAMEYNIPVNEAQRGMQEFFRVIPATVAFREETRRKVMNGDDLITPFGRHRRFWLITNANKKDVMNEALAFLPQSTASDLTLRAMTTLRPALKGVGFIRNLVHDSILGECPKENEAEMRRLIEEHMLASAHQLVGDYVKFGVDLASGDSWGTLRKAT